MTRTTQPDERPYEPTDGYMHPEDAAESLEVGDTVTVRYREHSGDPDEDPGDYVTRRRYEVTKCFPDGPGGIHVKEPEDDVAIGARRRWFRLHTVPGGTVTGTPPYGSRKRRYGLRAEVKIGGDA